MGDYLAEQRMIEESERKSMPPTLKEVREAKEALNELVEFAAYKQGGIGFRDVVDLGYTVDIVLTKLEEELG